MPNLYDIAYGLGLGAAAPAWLLVPKARRKVLDALRQRMGRGLPVGDSGRPAVLIHAVSLGEINATRALVAQLGSARPDLRFVVTTTTATGYARGLELYGKDPNVTLVRYPLDFSSAIDRLLTRLRPDVAVLMELEVWPNFVYHCRRRSIPVLLVNGRLTPSSFRGYQRVRWLVARTFRRLDLVCAQEQAYAERFMSLGTPAERVRVTGTMKFDTAQLADRIDGDDVLAAAVGIDPASEPVWVCGSTGPGEEELILRCYAALLPSHPRLRLVIVPRHPQRFDEVARLIRDKGFLLVRRSESVSSPSSKTSDATPSNHESASTLNPVILGDTMGELRKFYSLATVVFVGRSLVDWGPRQHGSDMIEPAALAKPVVVGPFTHNFAEAVNQFVAAGAIRVVDSETALRDAVGSFLATPDAAAAMGRRAQDVVRRERGATQHHVEVILQRLPPATAR